MTKSLNRLILNAFAAATICICVAGGQHLKAQQIFAYPPGDQWKEAPGNQGSARVDAEEGGYFYWLGYDSGMSIMSAYVSYDTDTGYGLVDIHTYPTYFSGYADSRAYCNDNPEWAQGMNLDGYGNAWTTTETLVGTQGAGCTVTIEFEILG